MPKNILVVDNNPVILKLMDNFLTKEGYNVKTALDSLKALEIIKNFQPDIIFVDLIMPNIPGEKLCKMLRRIPKISEVPIIILSAAAVEQKIDFKSFGADACIAKGPFKEVEKHIKFVFQQIKARKLSALGNEIIGTENVYERIVTTELLSTRQHFEVTLQNMAEGFVELTAGGRIVNINPKAADLFNQSEEDLLGSFFTDLFSGQQRDLISQAITEPDDKHIVIGESTPFMHNGKYLAMTIAQVSGQAAIIVIVQDVTARKLAEQELQAYQKNLEAIVQSRTSEIISKNRELEDEITERQQLSHEKKLLEQELRQTHKMEAIGNMATGIAHDFNNILTAVLGYAELLRLETNENPKAHSYLANITKAGYRAKELIGLIKTFSKPTEQEFVTVQLPPLIGETLALLKPSVPTNVKIITEVDQRCPGIWADEIQLQQVMLNLCSNAIHAIQDTGGALTITLSQENNPNPDVATQNPHQELITLIFADNGIGIAPENLEKIFDPYFTTKVGGEGTGLGLSVVHGIISNHGGQISVASKIGQGTTFTITLPVHEKI